MPERLCRRPSSPVTVWQSWTRQAGETEQRSLRPRRRGQRSQWTVIELLGADNGIHFARPGDTHESGHPSRWAVAGKPTILGFASTEGHQLEESDKGEILETTGPWPSLIGSGQSTKHPDQSGGCHSRHPHGRNVRSQYPPPAVSAHGATQDLGGKHDAGPRLLPSIGDEGSVLKQDVSGQHVAAVQSCL